MWLSKQVRPKSLMARLGLKSCLIWIMRTCHTMRSLPNTRKSTKRIDWPIILKRQNSQLIVHLWMQLKHFPWVRTRAIVLFQPRNMKMRQRLYRKKTVLRQTFILNNFLALVRNKPK
uniref:Uncharacterized protein n=1 Tax=Cacopsylla melanoneura TaxID=428564 RepID=A0A8D9BE25_9HEMI